MQNYFFGGWSGVRNIFIRGKFAPKGREKLIRMLRHPLYVDRKKEDNSDSVIHIYLFLLFGALMNLLLMIVNSWVKANQTNISNSEKIYRIIIYSDKAINEFSIRYFRKRVILDVCREFLAFKYLFIVIFETN